MKTITKKKLLAIGCCVDGVNKYFKDSPLRTISSLKKEVFANKDYSNAALAISLLISKKQNISWAIYSARQVLKIFEDHYPDDDRPRKAVQAAKTYLKNPSDANRAAARAAAYAAYAAASVCIGAAAYAAADAADAAHDAARAAAFTAAAAGAANAAHAAYAANTARAANAAYAAANAAYAAANAANAANAAYTAAAAGAAGDYNKTYEKLLTKGLAILNGENNE